MECTVNPMDINDLLVSLMILFGSAFFIILISASRQGKRNLIAETENRLREAETNYMKEKVIEEREKEQKTNTSSSIEFTYELIGEKRNIFNSEFV